MGIKEKIKMIRNNYVIRQVENIVLPSFECSDITRKKLIFKGRVQKVGFRFEFSLIAKKLELTGWVKNNTQGEIEQVYWKSHKINFNI